MKVSIDEVENYFIYFQVPLVYVSGKGGVGKTTFSNKMKKNGYKIIELDNIIGNDIAKKLKISDKKKKIELYKLYKSEQKLHHVKKARNMFIKIIRNIIKKNYGKKKILFEGTIKDNKLIYKLFKNYSYSFCYIAPKNSIIYKRNIQNRFVIDVNDDKETLGYLWKEIYKNPKALENYHKKGIDGKLIQKLLTKVSKEQYKIVKDLYLNYKNDFNPIYVVNH